MKHDPKAKDRFSAQAFPPKEGTADTMTKERAATLVGASDDKARDETLNTMFRDLFDDVKTHAASGASGDVND